MPARLHPALRYWMNIAWENMGLFGALILSLGRISSNGYFFWWKEVPQNTVKMAHAARKAAVKALGEIAVQHCPPTLDEAEALSLKNHQQ